MNSQDYQATLRSLPAISSDAGQSAWRVYLLEHSGLPGPRGNLELAQAVAAEGTEALFLAYLSQYSPTVAPVNSPEEFLAFCGALGLGQLLTEGKLQYLSLLRYYASDPRWRTREAIAIALQNWADPPFDGRHNRNLSSLLDEMRKWSQGNNYERRAVVAALCEPRLLTEAVNANLIFNLLNEITSSLASAGDRRDKGFQALRKALGYGWSVAIAAYPEPGKREFSSWLSCQDRDVRWVLNENLKKKRLIRMDVTWVQQCLALLEA
jgi:hypothetical protein